LLLLKPLLLLLLLYTSAAYYRGAMGILLVYDVTDEASFNNIRNWMRNIEQHASDNVNKVQHSHTLQLLLRQCLYNTIPGPFQLCCVDTVTAVAVATTGNIQTQPPASAAAWQNSNY
jgi:hypothetical protein